MTEQLSLSFILPLTPLQSRLTHNIEQSSLCYPVDPCWLSIFNTAVCTRPSQTPFEKEENPKTKAQLTFESTYHFSIVLRLFNVPPCCGMLTKNREHCSLPGFSRVKL